MINDKYIDILMENTLFADIGRTELKNMLTCFNPRVSSFNKNNIIVSRGDPFKGVGLVVSGSVKVVKDNYAGNHTIVVQIKEGSMFGEMAAFANIKHWPSTVYAVTDCTIIFISSERIIQNCMNLCPSHRTFIKNFLTILSERGLYLNRKIEYLTIKSIQGKICTYLYNEYLRAGKLTAFDIPFSRNELAEYLSVSRPSLSRELGELKKRKVIDFYLSTFKILDLDEIIRLMG